MEDGLGHDLGGVSLHDDADAATAARVLQARAFTLGSRVFFSRGSLSTSTPGGLRLLAHELVHTVQQEGVVSNVVQRWEEGEEPDAADPDPAEAQRRRAAERFAALQRQSAFLDAELPGAIAQCGSAAPGLSERHLEARRRWSGAWADLQRGWSEERVREAVEGAVALIRVAEEVQRRMPSISPGGAAVPSRVRITLDRQTRSTADALRGTVRTLPPEVLGGDDDLWHVLPSELAAFHDPVHQRNWGDEERSEELPRRDPGAGTGSSRGEVGVVGPDGRFEVDGRLQVADRDLFVVRIGGVHPGGWGYYPFERESEATAFAEQLAEAFHTDPSAFRQAYGIPDSWLTDDGTASPQVLSRTLASVFRLPQGSPFVVSQVAPQPEADDLVEGRRVRTYRGGALQVQFIRPRGLESRTADGGRLPSFPIPPSTVDQLEADPPQPVAPRAAGIAIPVDVEEAQSPVRIIPVIRVTGGPVRALPMLPVGVPAQAEGEPPPGGDAPGRHPDHLDEPSVVVHPSAYEPDEEEPAPLGGDVGRLRPVDHVASQPGGQSPVEMDAERGRVTTSIDATPGEESVRTAWGRARTGTGSFGEDVTTETSLGAEVGRGGAQVSGSRSRTRDYGEGVTSRTTHGGSVDLEGQAGYTYQRRTGREGDTRTTSAGGSAQLGDTGIEGAAVTASRSTEDGRSVSFSAGYTVDITRPRAEPGERWSVSGTITWRAAGTAGARSRTSSRSIGASGELSGSLQQRFTNTFPDRGEAREFYANNTRLLGLAQVFAFGGADADAVEGLEVGASVGDTATGRAGVTGTAGSPFISGSLSFSVSGSVSVDVERRSESVVRVTIRSMAGYDLGAALSSIGVGVGFGGGSSDVSGAILDYHTDTPEGSAALRRLLESRRPPRNPSGPGWSLVQRIVSGEEERFNVSASALAGGRSDSTRIREHRVDAEGNESVRAVGRRQDRVDTFLPDWIDRAWGLEGSETVEMESESGAGLRLSFRIDGTDAEAANELLAEAIGGGLRAHVSGVDAGEWLLSTSLTEVEFIRVVQEILRNGQVARTARAWLLTDADEGEDLLQRVRRAPTLDAVRVILAGFVADLGPRGAAYIRRIAGDDLRWSVRLVGSRTFTGEEGREAAREELHRLDPEDGAADISGLRAILDRERRRLARMASDESELPTRLRAQEEELQRSLVTEVEEAVRDARRARVSSARQGVDGGAPASSSERHRRARRRSSLSGDLERARARNRQQRAARSVIFSERRLHNEGPRGWGGGRPPREWLASVWIGEGSTYERIDRRWARAEELRIRGERLFSRAQDAGLAVSEDPGLSDAAARSVQEARRLAWQAHDAFEQALALWRRLYFDFRGLRNRHSDVDGFQRVALDPLPPR